MRIRQIIGTFAIAVGAAPVRAQQGPSGTAYVQMTVHLPDSLQSMMPVGGGTFAFNYTAATDGKRFVVRGALDLGGSSAALPTFQLMILGATGDDSLRIAGVMDDPNGTTASKGAIITLPLSLLDSIPSLFQDAGLMDSLLAGTKQQRPRALGTFGTVAGIRCEEWETVVNADTAEACLVARPPAIAAAYKLFERPALSRFLESTGILGASRQAYGGRDLVAIRTALRKVGMEMVLTRVVSGPPDPVLFDFPPGLERLTLPPGVVQSMMQGMKQGMKKPQ